MYNKSIEHIMAELERMDLLIRVKLSILEYGAGETDNARGLVISPEEIEELLKQPIGMPIWAAEQGCAGLPDVKAAMESLREAIEAVKEESLSKGVVLRLDKLREAFGLLPEDIDILLLALASEMDSRYEKFFAFLQDDVTQKRPSVDLILNLTASSYEEKLMLRKRFSSSAPLIKNRLVELLTDRHMIDPPLLRRFVKADDRIVSYLLDSDDFDSRILPYATYVLPKDHLEDMVIASEFTEKLDMVFRDGNKQKTVFYFQGLYGSGRKMAARCFCKMHGKGIFIVYSEPLLKTDLQEFKEIIELVLREAVLRNAAVYIEDFDGFIEKDKLQFLTVLISLVEGFRNSVFLSARDLWEPRGVFYDTRFISIEFPLLSHDQRIKLWERELNLSSEDIPYLQEAAGLFYFTGGQIKDAASTALNLAGQRSGRKLEKEDVFAACRLQSNRKLKDLARKITPNYRWEDIVLPKDRMAQLKDICSYVKYRALVYDTWGFKEKMSLGRGLNVIFSGPSGTGKTMSADIIAKELGLDLYKIDLSRIVSKYIGETEKNLSKIFEEAETSNSILFFDEADSIFGKRSEVKDAHDRYANIETGYLLQKMEEHTGIVILATNFRQNMDKAFLRRMHFIVDFPNPDKEDRHRIWKRIWPAKVPLNENIDFNSISSKFDVSGGNIKNIALSSAFLAAGQDTEVSMENIIKSIKREYQKMGKVVMEDDFAFDCEKRE